MKNSKFMFILAIFMMIISIGAVAAEDVSDDSDIAVADVSMGVDSSSVAVSDDVSSYGEDEQTSSTWVITDENYADYFVTDDESEEGDKNGTIREDSPIKAGDTIKLSNLEGKVFNINKQLTITADSGVVLHNCMVKLFEGADNSIISGLNITVDTDAKNFTGAGNLPLWPILAIQVSNVTIKDNTIFNNASNAHALGLGDVFDSVICNNSLVSASHPFYVLGCNNLICHNYVNSAVVPGLGGIPYVLYITRQLGHTKAIWYKNQVNGTISNNIFEYNTIDGSGSGWLVFGNGLLDNNTVNNTFRYNNIINGANAFQIQKAANYVIYGNNFTKVAIAINAVTGTKGWEVYDNNINATSVGIIVDWNDKVYNNNIVVNSTSTATGIKYNTEKTDGSVVFNNTIDVYGASAIGIDMNNAKSGFTGSTISDNKINAVSINKTAIGISGMNSPTSSMNIYNNLEITNNEITVASELDSIKPEGIDLRSSNNAVISNNKIDAKDGIGIYTYSTPSFVDELPTNNLTIGANIINAETGIKVGNSTKPGIINKVTGVIVDGNIINSSLVAIDLSTFDDISDVTISNNNLVVEAIEGEDAYAIYANKGKKLNIKDNTIKFTANIDNDGSNKQYALNIDNIADLLISGNNVNAIIPSVNIQYDWVTYAAEYRDLLLSVSNSKGVTIVSNDFVANDNNIRDGDYATLCNVHLLNNTGVVFNENNVDTTGSVYVYGIKAEGASEYDDDGDIVYYVSDVAIESNNIVSTSTGYYAAGLELDSPLDVSLSENTISANAVGVSYPVYAATMGGPINVALDSNTITGNANSVYGVELYGCKDVTIIKNTIVLTGNYTMGIATSSDSTTVIANTISANGEGLGEPTAGDAFASANVGIFANNYAKKLVVYGNDIATTGDVAINTTAAQNRIYDNKLVANSLVGDESVLVDPAVAENSKVSDNYPLVVVISANNVVKYYKNSTKLVGTLKDDKGNVLADAVVSITIGKSTYKVATDANGKFTLALNQAKGTYNVTIDVAGAQFVPTTKKVTLKVVKPTMKAVKAKVKKGKYLQVVFKNASGKAIKKQKVTLKVKGKTYTVTTNAKGIAKVKLNIKKGTYKVVAAFKKVNPYGKTTSTIKVKVI